MICREEIQKQLVERAFVTKKIRAEKSDIQKIVEEILNYIDMINSLPTFSSMCWGKPLDSIIIANEWKDLILPESVRLDPTDLKTENLLIKPSSKPSDDIADYVAFLNKQLEFRAFFKKDLSSDTTTVANLRLNKSLFDILPIAVFKDDDGSSDNPPSLRSIDEPFIPVKVKAAVAELFRSDYLNANCHYIISDYFAKFQF